MNTSTDNEITRTQVAIALSKLYTGTRPGDEMWGELDYQARMEKEYPLAGTNPKNEPRVFFRENTSTKQLLEESKSPFDRWKPAAVNFDLFNYELDSAGGCSESCEVY